MIGPIPDFGFGLAGLAGLGLNRPFGMGGFARTQRPGSILSGLGLGGMSPGYGFSFGGTSPSGPLTQFSPSLLNAGPQQQQQKPISPSLFYPSAMTPWPGVMNWPQLFGGLL